MKRLFLFLATILAATSCNNDSMNSSDNNVTSTLSLNVAASAPSSRVDVAEDGDAWAVTWNENDALSGFSATQAITYSMKFSMSEGGYDPENSNFTGKLPYNSTYMRLVYPYKYEYKFDSKSSSVALSLGNQAVSADFSHLGKTTYMISNEFEVESVTSSTSTTQTPVSMSHIGAAMELRVKFDDTVAADEADYFIEQATIGNNEVKLPIEGGVSIEDGSFDLNKNGAITLTASKLAAVNGVYTLRFNAFPFSLEAGEELPISLLLTDNDGKEFTATASVAATQDVEFARATKNSIYAKAIDLEEVGGDTAGDTAAGITFDGSELPTSYPKDGVINVDGMDFTLNYVGNFSQYGSAPIQFKKNVGYLYNNTEFKNLTKIVITLSESAYINNNFYVYAGAEKNPMEGTCVILDCSTSADQLVATYTVPEGTTYVAISSNTYTAYAERIEFFCDSEGGSTTNPDEGGTTDPDKGEDFTLDNKTMGDIAGTEISGSATVSGVDFEYSNISVDATHGTLYINCEGKSYIKNTTPIANGLTKIVVSSNAYLKGNIKISAGTTADVMTEVYSDTPAGSSWGSEYIYMMPKGAKYVSFESAEGTNHDAAMTFVDFIFGNEVTTNPDGGDETFPDGSGVAGDPFTFSGKSIMSTLGLTSSDFNADGRIFIENFDINDNLTIDGTVGTHPSLAPCIWNGTSIDVRLYKGNTLTFKSTGRRIMSIVFKSTHNNIILADDSTGTYEYTANNTDSSWSGCTSEVTFSSKDKSYINAFEVTLEAE